MVGLNNTGKGLMLDGLAAAAIYGSLHTADPGTTGTSEVSGGSPAYARKSITWAAASGGTKASSNAPVFDVPASTTITHHGFWSAVTAGTFYGSRALDADAMYQVLVTEYPTEGKTLADLGTRFWTDNGLPNRGAVRFDFFVGEGADGETVPDLENDYWNSRL